MFRLLRIGTSTGGGLVSARRYTAHPIRRRASTLRGTRACVHAFAQHVSGAPIRRLLSTGAPSDVSKIELYDLAAGDINENGGAIKWLAQEGQYVNEGEAVCRIGDGGDYPDTNSVLAPIAGRVVSHFLPPGTYVAARGMVLCRIDSRPLPKSGYRPSSVSSKGPLPLVPPPPLPKVLNAISRSVPADAVASLPSGGVDIVQTVPSDLADDHLSFMSCTHKVGDLVRSGEPVVTLETSKMCVDVYAERDGHLVELYAPNNNESQLKPGAKLFRIRPLTDDQTLSDARAALAASPKSIRAMHNVATLLVLQNGEAGPAHSESSPGDRLREAIRLWERASQLIRTGAGSAEFDHETKERNEPPFTTNELSQFSYNFGVALMLAGRLDDAIAAFGRAFVAAPQSMTVRTGLASALLVAQMPEEAIQIVADGLNGVNRFGSGALPPTKDAQPTDTVPILSARWIRDVKQVTRHQTPSADADHSSPSPSAHYLLAIAKQFELFRLPPERTEKWYRSAVQHTHSDPLPPPLSTPNPAPDYNYNPHTVSVRWLPRSRRAVLIEEISAHFAIAMRPRAPAPAVPFTYIWPPELTGPKSLPPISTHSELVRLRIEGQYRDFVSRVSVQTSGGAIRAVEASMCNAPFLPQLFPPIAYRKRVAATGTATGTTIEYLAATDPADPLPAPVSLSPVAAPLTADSAPDSARAATGDARQPLWSPARTVQFGTPADAASFLLTCKQPLSSLTGSGLSAASGLATRKTLWQTLSRDESVSIWNFERAPERLWQTVQSFLGGSDDRRAGPNDAHHALSWLHRVLGMSTHYTQNVDSLLQAAGVPDDAVRELHGTLNRTVCRSCGSVHGPATGFLQPAASSGAVLFPPKCIECKTGILKPDVVLFGESVNALRIGDLRELRSLIVVGTAADVSPASELPRLAKSQGGNVLEIKRKSSRLTNYVTDLFVAGEAEVVLPQIAAEVKRLTASGQYAVPFNYYFTSEKRESLMKANKWAPPASASAL